MPADLKVVLFTDQVQSTANTAARTHEEIAQVARAQDDLTAEVLRLTRGTQLKDTGDGCFAQFPSVLEAVRAGVLLQQRVAEHNAAQQNARLRFDLHVGIDVGELVVLDNGDLRGDAANRCARVCSACPPGEVYLSEDAARLLNLNEVELDALAPLRLKGIAGETRLYRVRSLRVQAQRPATPNPFIWRGGITAAAGFFDRDQEQRTLRAYLHGQQNCQIVGPRRIGKTSLLRQIERAAADWDAQTAVAYLDLQDPHCYTLTGWLSQAAKQCHWSTPATTLTDFADCVETALTRGLRPVLCLDEFEELTTRRAEFTRDFFLTLRACAQQGLSIVTASQRPLSELTDRGDPTSPFYNTFPLLRLGPFRPTDAQDFLTFHRPGTPPFSPDERAAILDFAKGHPLALQVACFHVLEAKQNGDTLTAALRRADDEMSVLLPGGW
ncbi:MAG TPA: adenylate/guanylate cyclase domain-containing protein [Pyrinomonadaceae bacterium]|jgi:class 3 adenylate cyclase